MTSDPQTSDESVRWLDPNNIAIDFACDIAIWLRVHADEAWTSENEAVVGLAEHLVRMVEGHEVGNR